MYGFAGTWNLNGHWVGPSHQGFDPTVVTFYMPSYFSLDTSIATDIGKWRVSLFAKNVTNQDKPIQLQLDDPHYGLALQPRTIGVSAEVKF
jgi:outer membrane receptor protein involved in Fe transport